MNEDLMIPHSGSLAQVVRCPHCRHPFSSIQLDFSGVHVKNGGDGYLATDIVRGSVLVIPGWCSDGHEFLINFGEETGATYAWAERASHIAPEEVLP